MKTRDFKALRPWVKYLFLHVCDQNMLRLNTYMSGVRASRCRGGCGCGGAGVISARFSAERESQNDRVINSSSGRHFPPPLRRILAKNPDDSVRYCACAQI